MHKFYFTILVLILSLISCSKGNDEIKETLYIRVSSPLADDIIIDKGKPTNVTFQVLAYNNESYPKQGIRVQFSASGELVPETAISDTEGYVTVKWTPSETGEKISLKAEIEHNGIVVSGNFIAKVQETPNPTPTKCVDLGLSVRWAGWNLGANKPYEYGKIYGWGETTEFNGTYKYLITASSHTFIGENISGIEAYDTARAIWGKEWRLPTKNEVLELFDKCEWRWCVYNNRNGILFTGPNGNSIFLPAPGIAEISNAIWSTTWPEGTLGEYWTGTYRNNNDNGGRFAYTIRIRKDAEYCGLSSWNRAEAINIRPVSDYPE